MRDGLVKLIVEGLVYSQFKSLRLELLEQFHQRLLALFE